MIRRMEWKDIPAVAELEAACFALSWKEEQIQEDLTKNPFCRGLVLEEDGRLCGYILYWNIFEVSELARIGIHPDFRKKGYARQLIAAMQSQSRQEEAQSWMLQVRVGNQPALQLYKSLGYRILHEVPHYYPDGENAYVMQTERCLEIEQELPK